MKCERFFDSYIPRQFIPVYSKAVSRIICGKRKEMNKNLICSLAAAALLAAGCSAPAAAPSEAETATAAEQFTASGAEAMTAAGMSDPIKEIVNTEDAVFDIEGNTASTALNIGTEKEPVYLDDNNYVTGYSYYNVMGFTAQVKQIKAMLDKYPDVDTVAYADGKTVSRSFVEDMNTLVDRLNAFDPTLSLKYDFDKAGSNYIASNGSAVLEFHVQTNGYWGYDLAGDSIIDKVVNEPGGYMENQELNNKYAQFFTVDLTDRYEGLYILNDTDLQNPVLYMNDDEAFLVDVDFRGAENLKKILAELVGDKPLYIYITHAHGDHYQNLDAFDTDAVAGLYYSKTEPVSGEGVGGTKLEDTFQRWVDAGKMIYYEDGDIIERAGKQFEVVIMSNHTAGGSQLIDLTDRILLSGDTLGAQTFKGGTSLGLDSVDMWIGEFDHSIEALDLNGESKIDYIIGGHTGYLNTWEFENWVYTCLQELRENGEEALYANPIGQNTIVVKDGAVLTEEEKAAQFKDGTPVPAISDEEVTHVASINVRLPQPEQ